MHFDRLGRRLHLHVAFFNLLGLWASAMAYLQQLHRRFKASIPEGGFAFSLKYCEDSIAWKMAFKSVHNTPET